MSLGAPLFTTATRFHPDLANRKQVVARMLVARSFSTWLRPNHLERTRDTDALANHALNEACVPTQLRDDVSMDKYISVLVERTERYVRENGLEADQVIALMVSDLADHSKHINCGRCTNRAGVTEPCKGAHSDSQITQHGLDCWRFINDLFKSLVDLSYSVYGRLLPNGSALHIALETERSRNHDLHGATQFEDDATVTRRAQVLLEVPVESFDLSHWAQLPYFAFHEIFVHTAESFLQPDARTGTDETCPFREGYMDAAAQEFLITVLKRHQLPLPTIYHNVGDALADATEEAHKNRVAVLGVLDMKNTDGARRASKLRFARRTGDKAFADVSQTLGSEAARRIGAAANVLELNHRERIHLTVGLQAGAKSSSGRAREWLRAMDTCSRQSDAESRNRRIALIRSLSADAF